LQAQRTKAAADNEAALAKLRKQLVATQKAASEAEAEATRMKEEAIRIKEEAARTKAEAASVGANASKEVEILRARLLLVERELVEAEEARTSEAERSASLLSAAENRAVDAERRANTAISEVDSLRGELQCATQRALDAENTAAMLRWQVVLATDAAAAAEANAKALAVAVPASATELVEARIAASQAQAELADVQRELDCVTAVAEQQVKRTQELEAALRDARADALANIAIVEATQELARTAVSAAKAEVAAEQSPRALLERIYEMARTDQEARDALVEYVSTLPLIKACNGLLLLSLSLDSHRFSQGLIVPTHDRNWRRSSVRNRKKLKT